MADFELNIEDLSSTKNLGQKIGEHYYPNGQVVVKNTTMSRMDSKDRTLRSADPARLLQGDGVYRNPALLTVAYTQSTQSALHSILAARTDLDDGFKISDLQDPTGKTTLTGAAARMELMKRSIMSTGLAPSGFEQSLKAMSRSILNGAMGSIDSSGNFVMNDDDSTFSHGDIFYGDPGLIEAYNGVIRDVAIKSNISEEEKKIYDKKISDLKSKVNFDGGGDFGSFNLDFSEMSKYPFRLKQLATYYGRRLSGKF